MRISDWSSDVCSSDLVGKVWSDTDRLPQDFGYRTGGARTIRGYRYQSIGLDRGDAVVGAPALAVASIQYTHYFTEMLGMNYFIDVGDAAESFGDMDPAIGIGVGLSVRTPADRKSTRLNSSHSCDARLPSSA